MIINKRFKMKALGSKRIAKFDGSSAPAVKGNADNSVSPRYVHVSTSEVVDIFARFGWEPTSSCQKRRTSTSTKSADSVAHMVEFHNPSLQDSLGLSGDEMGSLSPVLYVTNSHDGSKSLTVDYGFFRLVCQNGLALGERFGSFSVRHYGKQAQMTELEERLACVAERFGEIVAAMRRLDSKTCSETTAKQIALKGLELKYGLEVVERLSKANETEFNTLLLTLAKPIRLEDAASSLFSVMNVVQEDLVNGLTLLPKVEGTKRTRRISSAMKANEFTSQLIDYVMDMAMAA
jgi:hypothetical protein